MTQVWPFMWKDQHLWLYGFSFIKQLIFLLFQVQARLDLVWRRLGSAGHLLELYRIPRLALQRQSGQSEIIASCLYYCETGLLDHENELLCSL